MRTIKVKITKQENADYFNLSIGDIVELSFREYLKGVVASEIGNAHIEACKAQAIASRTTAYPYFESDKAISDSSASVQAFRADRMTSEKYTYAHEAVESTAGMILMYNGKVCSPCSYSSSNGGRTTSSEDRWGGYRAWLIEQDDPWDSSKKTGHGVGMSQTGAKNAAQAGVSFRDILSFYYPNTTIGIMEGADDCMAVKASYQVEKFKYMADKKWKYVANAARQGEVDCSGAFSYWYKQAGGYMYHGSNTMWRKYCTEKGKTGEIELVPGMAVYKVRKWTSSQKSNPWYGSDPGDVYHVGQYVGNGRVVEAKGTNYGVVYSDLNQWSLTSKLKDTDYDLPAEQPRNDETSCIKEGHVKTEGGRLRVRKSPVSGAVIGQLNNGSRISIIGEVDGWYKILFNGQAGYVSGSYIVLSNSWTITVDIDSDAKKDEIVTYLESKGLSPKVVST